MGHLDGQGNSEKPIGPDSLRSHRPLAGNVTSLTERYLSRSSSDRARKPINAIGLGSSES